MIIVEIIFAQSYLIIFTEPSKYFTCLSVSAALLKCFLSFKLNFLYASGFPAKKPLSLVSEFFDLLFILNFVYASQFVFYVVVYTKTIRQLGLVVYEQIVDSGSPSSTICS